MILPHFLPPHVSVLFSHAQRAFGRNLQITTKLFYEKLKQKSMTLLKKKNSSEASWTKIILFDRVS